MSEVGLGYVRLFWSNPPVFFGPFRACQELEKTEQSLKEKDPTPAGSSRAALSRHQPTADGHWELMLPVRFPGFMWS